MMVLIKTSKMKKESYQNKMDKRPIDNKKAKDDEETHNGKLFDKAIKKSPSERHVKGHKND